MSSYLWCPEFYEQYKNNLYQGYRLCIDPTTGYVNVTQLFIDNGLTTNNLIDIWKDGDLHYELNEIAYGLREDAGLDMEEDFDYTEIYFTQNDGIYVHPDIIDVFIDHIKTQ